MDLDVVANCQAATFENHVPGEAVFTTVQLAGRAKPNPLATPRIFRLTLERYVERDRPSDVANRKVTGELEILFVALNVGALELDDRELLHIQEVSRPQVLIALLDSRIQRSRIQRDLDCRICWLLLIDEDLALNASDSALHCRNHQMLCGKLHQCMRRI